MIDPQDHLGVFAALLVIATASFWLEKTRIGQLLTGTVLVILASIAAANIGIIPHQAPTYDFVFTYLVPLLIPLFLLQGDVRRLLREASRTTAAFLVATLGTIVGVLLAISLLDVSGLAVDAQLSPEETERAVAGLFAATYIGGSVNYAALGEITGLSRDASFFSAATAADNLFSALFLSVLGLLPSVRWVAQRFGYAQPDQNQSSKHNQTGSTPETAPITPTSLCTATALSAGLVTISDSLSIWLDFSGGRYIILTLLTLIAATALPRLRIWCAGVRTGSHVVLCVLCFNRSGGRYWRHDQGGTTAGCVRGRAAVISLAVPAGGRSMAASLSTGITHCV